MSAVLLSCLTLAGIGLPAQDFSGGVCTGLSLPAGDLKGMQYRGTNREAAFHLGAFFEVRMAPRDLLRPHLTYQDFSGSDWSPGPGGPRTLNHFNDFQLGMDWIHHFRDPQQGWYALAGFSIHALHNKREISQDSGPSVVPQNLRTGPNESQYGRPGLRLGGGHTFSRAFALEATWTQVSVVRTGDDGFGFGDASWMQLSAVFRFGR